jgi:hypothetical protein
MNKQQDRRIHVIKTLLVRKYSASNKKPIVIDSNNAPFYYPGLDEELCTSDISIFSSMVMKMNPQQVRQLFLNRSKTVHLLRDLVKDIPTLTEKPHNKSVFYFVTDNEPLQKSTYLVHLH